MKTTGDFLKKTKAAGVGFGVWVCLMLLSAAGAWAQAPAPAWRLLTALTTQSRVLATATDSSGNLFVAGLFRGTVAFGSLSLTSTTNENLFVAKRDGRTGLYTWVTQGAGFHHERPLSLVVTGSRLYLAGTFVGTASFGTGISVTSSQPGDEDVFIARLDDLGNSSRFAWVKTGGSPYQDYISGLAVAGANVYASGVFYGTQAAFGNTVLTNSSSNAAEVFVTKLVDTGSNASFAWGLSAGGRDEDRANALAVSGGNLYLSGISRSPVARFGAFTLTNSLTGPHQSVFIAKVSDLGSNGTIAWLHQLTNADDTRAIAANGANVYVTGRFGGGSLVLGSNVLPGPSGFFVAKMVDTGSAAPFAWGKKISIVKNRSYGLDSLTAVLVQGNNVYVAGTFSDTLRCEAQVLGTNGGINSWGDAFVFKFDDQGSQSACTWSKQAGTNSSDEATSLAWSAAGLYVGGSVSPGTVFDGQVVPAATASGVGFVALLPQSQLATHLPLATKVALYPNPAHFQTTIHLPEAMKASTAILTLLDALGRPVRQQTTAPAAAGTEVTFDVAGLAAGVYALRVQAGAYTATQKLVVE